MNVIFSRSLQLLACVASQNCSSQLKNASCSSVKERKNVESKPILEIPIFLKPSSNPRRKPSFYIPRMREEHSPSNLIRADCLGTAQPLFTISSGSCEYYALRLPLLKAGFKRVVAPATSTACNLIWGRSLPLRKVSVGKKGEHDKSEHVWTLPSPQTEERAAQLKALTMKFPTQVFNHFPLSHRNIGCKKGLAKNIRALASSSSGKVDPFYSKQGVHDQLQSMYSFIPKTWCFPEEKEELHEAFRKAPPSSHFIWKPARGSCGRGIFFSEGGAANARSWERVEKEILHRLETERKCEGERAGLMYRQYVVQEYVDTPLLLDGRKMDLRLYVAVTSYDPLVVYLHEDGLVRLAAEKYNENQIGYPSSSSTSSREEGRHEREGSGSPFVSISADRFKHLTNFSVGRKHAKYAREEHGTVTSSCSSSALSSTCSTTPTSSSSPVYCSSTILPKGGKEGAEEEEEFELKWSLPRLWRYIDDHYPTDACGPATIPRSQEVLEEIALVIVRTLFAVQGNVRAATERLQMAGRFVEVYGVDVLLKADLSPVLLEVNTLPSLESSSPFDYAAKSNMMADFLNLMMMEAFEREGREMVMISSNKKLSQPPNDALLPLIHTLKDQEQARQSFGDSSSPFHFHNTTREGESREDLVFRLNDEMIHARGFQRIFPPALPSTAASVGNRVYRHLQPWRISCGIYGDIKLFDSLGLFSEKDKWALSV